MNRAGSFLYEPAGSVHTLTVLEDDTHVWFQMYGANLNLDADGNVESVFDGPARCGLLPARRGGRDAAARGAHRADSAGRPDRGRPSTSPAPTRFVAGPPHEALAELRRTRPVHWQDMPDEPGFWAVLRHADVVHVARQPELFSASEGGVVLEDLEPERLEMMRDMLLAMDPPRHADYRKPLAPQLPGPGHRRARGPRSATICTRRSWPTPSEKGDVEFVHDVTAGCRRR